MESSKEQSKIAILGAGPGGMAAGLALLKAGHHVTIIERYHEAKAAGGILGLWPPAIKALRDMDVDLTGLGAPCHITFRNAKGHVRADVHVPEQIKKDYGAAFFGLLRRDLYARMLAAIPEGTIQFGREVTRITSTEEDVQLHFADGVESFGLLIGADGIDSVVRKHLWGDSPKRLHNVYVIGGWTFDDIPDAEVLESWPDNKEAPDDLLARAKYLAREFPSALQDMISKTKKSDCDFWQIRDREPIKQWSKGRITLLGKPIPSWLRRSAMKEKPADCISVCIGDAAHPVSPYAGYGVAMAVCDGYFLGQLLNGVNLGDTSAVKNALARYEEKRIAHTTDVIKSAYVLTHLFHHLPWPLSLVRDLIMDHTNLLQTQVGDHNSKEIFAQLEEMGAGILGG